MATMVSSLLRVSRFVWLVDTFRIVIIVILIHSVTTLVRWLASRNTSIFIYGIKVYIVAVIRCCVSATWIEKLLGKVAWHEIIHHTDIWIFLFLRIVSSQATISCRVWRIWYRWVSDIIISISNTIMQSLIHDHLIFFIIFSSQRSWFCIEILMNRIILILIKSFVACNWTTFYHFIVS